VKLVFVGTFVALVLLSVAAWRMQPEALAKGKTPLVWVSDDNPARRGQIALFNRLYPRYQLRLDPSNGGMEKVIVQSLGGVGPDLFDCYDGFQLSAYVKSGIAWDLTEALRQSGLDPRRAVWPAILPDLLSDGRLYGFGSNVCADAVWIHKTIFDEEGVPYPKGPWTWQQFIPLAQRLTKRDAQGRAVRFGFMFEWWNWLHFVDQWGGRVYTPDGTRCVVDSPQTIAAVQFMHDLIYKYRVAPSPVEEAAMATQGGWGSGTITRFGAGKAAMALGGRWWLCTLRDYQGLRLGAVESPHARYRIFRGYAKATLINKNSPHRREALQFLRYQSSKEYNDLINDQADGLGPVIHCAYTPRFFRNPQHPEEEYNAVWRDAAQRAQPDPINPFVNGQVASRILNKQLDLVKNDQKPAAAAMKDAARQINEEIRKSIEQDPSLRRRYRDRVKVSCTKTRKGENANGKGS
jgi:multiple sugar transport system substrate-binding protein